MESNRLMAVLLREESYAPSTAPHSCFVAGHSASRLMSAFHPILPLAPVPSPRTDRRRSTLALVESDLALATRPKPSPAVRRLVTRDAVDNRRWVRDARLLGHVA